MWHSSVCPTLIVNHIILGVLLSYSLAQSRCVPGPATFPLTLRTTNDDIIELRNRLDDSINSLLRDSESDIWRQESWAVQLTSAEETLWSSFSNASELKPEVNGDTSFRIASISKTITMYALLLEKSIDLDDPVTLYISELMHRKEEPWFVNWEQVTLRSLASYLGGLPRDTGSPCFVWREVLEMGYSTSDLAKAGLPTSLGHNNLLENMACTSSDIIDRARTASRIFTVNDRPTYSNAAFSLLGIILERASGLSFEEGVTRSVLKPLGMNSTTTRTPAKNKSIIPLFPNHWGIELGAADATAGFYSTPNDLSRYLRSILRAELLPPSTINAWLKPHSWTDSGTSSAYGLAWELYRTTRLTHNGRPLDIILKTGALHGYHSCAMLIPEFGQGLSVMVAGKADTMEVIREAVIKALIPAIESIARKQAVLRYAGEYRYLGNDGSNGATESYMSIKVDQDGPGLYVSEWISNGTDLLSFYGYLEGMPTRAGSCSAKLIPANRPEGTNLEMWRIVLVEDLRGGNDGVFGDFRLTDIDNLEFGGQGLGDIVVVLDNNSRAFEIYVQALGIRLQRIY